MEPDIEKLYNERKEDNHAVLDGFIPKRVPINLSVTSFAVAELAGVDPKLSYWDPSVLLDKAIELGERIPTDVNILGRSVLQPSRYEPLGSIAIVMGANGFMQHPNTHMMEPEEYDEFCEDPYAFIVEKGVPRVSKELADPSRVSMAISISDNMVAAYNGKLGAVNKKISDKFGYFANPPVGGGGYAPMDILSDQLRSFSGMLTDVRRCPDKVKAAVEAVSPMNYMDSRPGNPAIYTRYSYGFYPFHMATFMRPKDFENLWWPALKRQWDGLASEGFRCGAFLEHNWDHLLDYIQDLPTGSLFTFEYTDPKLLKEKLGKKMVLSSGFPMQYLTQVSPEEAADKTKEFLDIMAPGGGYMFGLDKSILVAADVHLENLEAVAKTVREYGVYDNPGERCLEEFHKEDYKPANLPQFKSRLFKTWEQYKEQNPNTPEAAKPYVEAAEKAMVKFYLGLLK